MIAKDLITKVRKTRGPILVELINFHDQFWVQAVKSDIIYMIQETFSECDETGFEIDDEGRFCKDYLNGY